MSERVMGLEWMSVDPDNSVARDGSWRLSVTRDGHAYSWRLRHEDAYDDQESWIEAEGTAMSEAEARSMAERVLG